MFALYIVFKKEQDSYLRSLYRRVNVRCVAATVVHFFFHYLSLTVFLDIPEDVFSSFFVLENAASVSKVYCTVISSTVMGAVHGLQ